MNFNILTPTQSQLRALEGNGSGNLVAVYRLAGDIDFVRLKCAVRDTIVRCLALQYRYLKLGDEFQIFVSPDLPEDMSEIEAPDSQEDFAYSMIRNLTSRAFRLDGGSPYLFALLKGTRRHYLVFSCHPALLDRFSLGPIFQAISRAYRGEALPTALALEQSLLLDRERALIQSPRFGESIAFWTNLIGDSEFAWHPPRLEGDLDETYSQFTLDREAALALQDLARTLLIPVPDLLMLSFHLFLHRFTRSDTLVTSRYHRIIGNRFDQVGFSENKLPLKSVIDPAMNVRRFLKLSSRLLEESRRHSDLPAKEVLREIQRFHPEFKRTSNLLFDRDRLPYEDLKLEGAESRLLPSFCHRLESEDVAIFFDVNDAAVGKIEFHLLSRVPQYASGLKQAFQHYLALLKHLPAGIDRPIEDLNLMSEPLRAKALSLAEGGPLPTTTRDAIESFAYWAKERPKSCALSFKGKHMTYGALFTAAGRLAAGLTKRTGRDSRKECRIGVALPRGIEMVQAVFGILFGGAAYVPIDPDGAPERLRFIVEDAGLTAILTDRETAQRIDPKQPCPLLTIEDLVADSQGDNAPTPVAPNRAAYVIYTSGTTGKPKGVVIERGMLAHCMASIDKVWERGPGTRWLQFASLTFDASVLDLFSPLTQGGECVIAPSEARTDPQALFELMRDSGVTHACIPPALLPLLPRRPLPDLRALFCGGEAIEEEAARFWSKVVDLGNCYGPTEATVMAMFNPLFGYKTSLQLGRPLPGYQVYLLSPDLELAPLGGVGEIFIGGGGVARGYLGRPELTALKFETNPYGPGRLYRTGDLGRYLPNGEIEFLGRGDFQVKVRGFRIELGEIEAAITDQPDVTGAYVTTVDGPGGKSVAAWYISKGLPEDALRARLAMRLPHYMVPASLVRVEGFPLTSNGKIDRARLQKIAPQTTVGRTSHPLDTFEERLRAIWANVLGVEVESIGLESQFFRLGGHSLTAALVCSRLQAEQGITIRPKALFEAPVFQDFCARVRSAFKEDAPLPPIIASEDHSAPVVSRLIRILYSRFSSNAEDTTYNVVMRIAFGPGIDPERLSRCFTQVFNGHRLFRANLEESAQGLRVVENELEFPRIPVESGSEQDLDDIIEALKREPLPLDRPPLWRIRLIETGPGIVEAVFSIHHALFDGWSLNLMLDDLSHLYMEPGVTVDQARPSWLDYCRWEGELGKSKRFNDAIKYWQDKLTDFSARVELPVGAHHRIPNSNRSEAVHLEPELVARLKRLADQLEVTLPPVLFSLYLVWLWRLSNQSKIACSYPYAGRDFPGTEKILGNFVHMAVLTEELEPRRMLRELITAVHRQMIDDKDNLIAAPYDAGIPGLDSLNVIFSLQTGIGLEGAFGDSRFKVDEVPSASSKADISGIFYSDHDGGISGRIEYDHSLFTAENVASWVRCLTEIVTSAAEHPEARIAELEYRTGAETERVEHASIGPEFRAVERSIASRFSEISKRYPEHTAILCEGRSTSYADLDHWSNEIASTLEAEVASGSYVGISLERGERLIASVLGILKAGCAFVPLDPKYPLDRLRHFIDTCEIPVILADAGSRDTLGRLQTKTKFRVLTPGGKPEVLNLARPKRIISPDQLAYVIFTSGSTGLPKGVMIDNGAVVTMISAIASGIDFVPECIESWVASLNFDASIYEIFLPLLHGGTLAIMEESARKDPALLHQRLRETETTHCLLTPVLLSSLPREALPALKIMAFGGDSLDELSARYWSGYTRLFTMYGPTETTVIASHGEISPGSDYRVIGKPLPGYRIYLLNPNRQPVPYGAVGEIAIASPCVARGYVGQPELNFEKFVMDPFDPSPYSVMYLTGDLGRFNSDGTVEFHGRNDQQIKLRGFRVELGEIESAIAAMDPALGIEQSVCAFRGTGDARCLVAYYVSGAPIADETFRSFLADRLPDYMVPAFFKRLDHLPQTPSGKLDRKALPEISELKCESPPLPGIETEIGHIWEDLLQIKGIARNESFFHLGGNSLLAVRMQSELKRRLGLEVGLGEFYRSPATIEALAAGRQVDHLKQAIQDAETGVAGSSVGSIATVADARCVLLTGASGFLGRYLLKELVNAGLEVLCLSPHSGSLEAARGVRIIPGDLSLPGLGLSEIHRREINEKVDRILHCGAIVHHLQSYSSLRAANVMGTRALLELALEKRVKPFCYISTQTAASALAGADRVPEEVSPFFPAIDNGYLLSKWASERLVSDASRRLGLPALIIRPGNITGDSKTGFSNYANNHFWLLIKGCLQLGVFPQMASRVEMTPVDQLARAIVKLFLGHGSGLFISNLSNPETIAAEEFCRLATSSGFPLRAVPSTAWQERLGSLPQDNALMPIREFYRGDLSQGALPVDQKKTLVRLEELGESLVSDYAELVPLYLRYLAQEGFIVPEIAHPPFPTSLRTESFDSGSASAYSP